MAKNSERDLHLKRYESEACALPRKPDFPDLEVFSPFGPYICRTRMPEDLVRRLNAMADSCCEENRSSELVLDRAQCSEGDNNSLVRFAGSFVHDYLAAQHQTNIAGVNFEAFWIVNQVAETNSPTHFHSTPLAGVVYLRTPEIDETNQQNSYMLGRKSGYINFLWGGKQQHSRSIASFKPTVGDAYLFPGWLLHVAEPFLGTGLRRSLAFNASPKHLPVS